METLFETGIEQKGASYALILELTPDGCCSGLYNIGSGELDVQKYTLFNDFEWESGFESLLATFENTSFHKVVIGCMFQEALLIPREFQLHSDKLLALVFDKPRMTFIHDTINEWQMVTAYTLPQPVYQLIREKFPDASVVHHYTATLKKGTGAQDQVSLCFTKRYFSVLVRQQGHLHLAQIYNYRSELDVIYFLLKICSELKIEPAGILLSVSGYITDNSGLHKTLLAYFPHIEWVRPHTKSKQASRATPVFDSLYNIAACAL